MLVILISLSRVFFKTHRIFERIRHFAMARKSKSNLLEICIIWKGLTSTIPKVNQVSLITFCLLSNGLFAHQQPDTLYYENGKICQINNSSKDETSRYRNNGVIFQYRRKGNLLRREIFITYDSLGRITQKGDLDYTYYGNGIVRFIRNFPKQETNRFHRNGQLYLYMRQATFLRKGKMIWCNSTGKVIQKGKTAYTYVRHGKIRIPIQ